MTIFLASIFAFVAIPVLTGMVLGIFDTVIPDNEGFLELNEHGIYELRIL